MKNYILRFRFFITALTLCFGISFTSTPAYSACERNSVEAARALCEICINFLASDCTTLNMPGCFICKCPPNATCPGNNIVCKPGYVPTPDGMGCQLINCGAGQYLSGATCAPCQAGRYQNSTSHTQTSCPCCPAGTYQNLTGQTTCKTCPANATCNGTCNTTFTCNTGYKKNASGTACEPIVCGVGQYLSGSTCVPCQAGRYQNAPSHSNTTCPCCADGSYQDNTGQTSCKNCPANATCSGTCNTTFTCNKGYQKVGNACVKMCPPNCEECLDPSTCTKCEDGFILHEGQCILTCPTGYYQSGDTCLKCPCNTETCTNAGFTCPEYTYFDSVSNVCCPNNATCSGGSATCVY